MRKCAREDTGRETEQQKWRGWGCSLNCKCRMDDKVKTTLSFCVTLLQPKGNVASTARPSRHGRGTSALSKLCERKSSLHHARESSLLDAHRRRDVRSTPRIGTWCVRKSEAPPRGGGPRRAPVSGDSTAPPGEPRLSAAPHAGRQGATSAFIACLSDQLSDGASKGEGFRHAGNSPLRCHLAAPCSGKTKRKKISFSPWQRHL